MNNDKGEDIGCDGKPMTMYVSISESGTHYIPKPEGGTIIFSQTLEETKKQLDKMSAKEARERGFKI